MVKQASNSDVHTANSYREILSDEDLIRGFLLDLGTSGRTKRTGEIYGDSIRSLSAFAHKMGFPPLAEMGKDHVRHWLTSIYQAGNKPGGVHVRYRAVNRFFGWSVTEGERPDNPMDHISPPRLPDVIQPYYQPHEVEKVLKATGRGTVYGLRDAAVVLTLFDTRVRAAELCGMPAKDVDWKDLSILVTAKAEKQRRVSFGHKTATAIERYLRKRPVKSDYLWLTAGRRPFTNNGLRMMLQRRFAEAAVQFRGAHAFRRGFAMQYLEAAGRKGT